MDLNWLIAARKALTAVGALQPFAKRAGALLARLFNIEVWREGEQLRNEATEIQNMQAYGKVVVEYSRQLKAGGASTAEIDALVADLLLARLRSYIRARGIIALRATRTAKRRKAPERQVPPASMERRNAERRARQGARNDDGLTG